MDRYRNKSSRWDCFRWHSKTPNKLRCLCGSFPGVEGLVHISQISLKHIATPHEVLHEGDQVQVKVLEVNPEEHRIALSIKALEPKPESQEEPKEEQEYELPEENTGFTMGDILGDALSDAKEEE